MINQIRQQDREKKIALLKALEPAIKLADPEVDRLELTPDRENVLVYYSSGYARTACIAADSPVAIIADIAKVVMM